LKLRNFLFLSALVFTLSCGNDSPFSFEDDYSNVPEPFSTTGAQKVVTESGLTMYILEEGSGDLTVSIRDVVRVFYTGRKTNTEIFDSSYKNDQTEPSRLTVTNLIPGFTEGIIGMKEGGKRVLIIPPNLGYEGTSNALREDTLVFDVQIDTIIF